MKKELMIKNTDIFVEEIEKANYQTSKLILFNDDREDDDEADGCEEDVDVDEENEDDRDDWYPKPNRYFYLAQIWN